MARPSRPAWLDRLTSDTTRAEWVDDERWKTIFVAIAEGEIRALDELYDLAATDIYRLALWRTGSREDAEDVVQDVFVRVAEQGGRLKTVRHPRRWLLTVTHRRAIDLVRGRSRRQADPLDDVPYLEAMSGDPDRGIDAHTVSRLIGTLPTKQREVLMLRHFADCSFAEIGRITGAPIFTAASRYRLAVARLRHRLETTHEPPR